MSRHVNAIAGRLSLRPPQRESLEILDRVAELVPPRKGNDPAAALAAIQREYPSVRDFEREFPSLCFALATGVGKTRLMGAFISYLHLTHGIRNFFVLAPNLTIYDKLIADFTPNTPKYVFRGIAEFASDAPEIITGDNYEGRARTLFDDLIRCKVNIFNISKINAEVRGGKSPRIKRLSEYIGESYFDYLAGLDDLVVLMDESHRYRASAGVRAINELKPVLGLELTATPFVETSKGTTPFRNVILDYPLARAINDGFVKDPAVVTRKNFDPSGMSAEEIERLKLEDGIRLHEQTKVLLETYAREAGVPIVKPFVLVIARDTTHASALMQLIQHDDFFAGAYRERVIQVDSSKTGAEEDAMVARLLKVEHADEPTEIVIHVNMLKEGWDVTNLYTIVPLRAANARVLIEQSIGRGLRLPYGQRTGVPAVDRLSIVAHDRFQEIVDEAKRPDSVIRLQTIVLDDDDLTRESKTVVAQSWLKTALGMTPTQMGARTEVARFAVPPAFSSPEEKKIAGLAYDAIFRRSRDADRLPRSAALTDAEIQAELVREITEEYRPAQLEMEGVTATPDIAAVVERTTELVIRGTIDIPRILVVPETDVRAGFEPFKLDFAGLRLQPPSDELWVQYLQSGSIEVVGLGTGGIEERRLEDYVVSGLVDFDDVAYDEQADLLYDLAGQTVTHLRGYLAEEDVAKVLRRRQREIARFVYAQMHEHRSEEELRYRFEVRSGFVEIKDPAYTRLLPDMDFRQAPADKSNMARYVFDGFTRSLHPVQKFQSDPERVCALILDREAEKWFRPAKGQFHILYKDGFEVREYQPDFVAETAAAIYMLEVKARNELETDVVRAKRAAAVAWCESASAHAASCGGKPWIYALVPHDRIKENMTIDGLIEGG